MPDERTAQLDSSVDALSDVLDLVRLRGETLTATRGGAAAAHGSGERVVHLVESGTVELVVGRRRLRLEAGDTALLATGAAHRISSKDDGAWMSGRFLADETAAAALLSVLPAVIVIRAAEAGVQWIALAGELLRSELVDPSAGSRVMVSRVLDLVFIRVLRAWAAGDGAGGDPGWLTAALDRPLGPALRAIHRHPERSWSVDELAGLASMSRAAFAARFTRKVGDPPARYLARIRLARAADRLATTDDAVGAVSRAVGYESEAAFSRAFSRAYAMAPGAWRASVSAKNPGAPANPADPTSP